MGKGDRVGYPPGLLPFPIKRLNGDNKMRKLFTALLAGILAATVAPPPPLWVSAEAATDESYPSWGTALSSSDGEMTVYPTGWNEMKYLEANSNKGTSDEPRWVPYSREANEGHTLYAVFFGVEGNVSEFDIRPSYVRTVDGPNRGRVRTHKYHHTRSKRCNGLVDGVDVTYCMVVFEVKDEVTKFTFTWQYRKQEGGETVGETVRVGTWRLHLHPRHEDERHQVTLVDRLVDGDTFHHSIDDNSLRLLGIQAPEEKYDKDKDGSTPGSDATKYLADLLLVDKLPSWRDAVQVVLEKDVTDRNHNRMLRYVWGEGFINQQMVQSGHAEPTCLEYPKDIRYIHTIGGCDTTTDTTTLTATTDGTTDASDEIDWGPKDTREGCEQKGYYYRATESGRCLQREKGDIYNCGKHDLPEVEVLGLDDPSKLDRGGEDGIACG